MFILVENKVTLFNQSMFLMANPPQVWHQQCLSTEIGRTFRTTEIFVFNHYFFFSRWQLNSLNELKMVKKNCCWMERSNWEGVFKCSVTNWHSGSQLTAAATPFRSHKKRASTEVQPPDNMSNIKSNILGSCCIQAIIHIHIYIYWYVRKVQHKHRKKKYCNNK